MAKRKRLTPAQAIYLSGDKALEATFSSAPGKVPIAQVAKEVTAQAALEDLTNVLEETRARGLMIQELPLGDIDLQLLVRDRVEHNQEEMASLMASLKSRGQQTPIEVVRLEHSPKGYAYGLVSGWRRMKALSELYNNGENSKFNSVQARIIQPETIAAAYTSMVEENEIRVNLSHYERARIVVEAMKQGVFDSQKQALKELFGNATRSKRSKIRSFVTLVENLDDILEHPSSISEKLGLSLVQKINETPDFTVTLREKLLSADRANQEDESHILSMALNHEQAFSPSVEAAVLVKPSNNKAKSNQLTYKIMPSLTLGHNPQKKQIELTGEAVDEALVESLQVWLKSHCD